MPGAPTLGGAGTSLQFAGGINNSVFGPLDPTFNDVATGNTDGSGSVTLSAKPDRSGTLRFNFPRFNDLSPTTVGRGLRPACGASVDLQSACGHLERRAAPGPARPLERPALGHAGHRRPGQRHHADDRVQTVNLPTLQADTFDTPVPLGAGTWSLKAAYSDPTADRGRGVALGRGHRARCAGSAGRHHPQRASRARSGPARAPPPRVAPDR